MQAALTKVSTVSQCNGYGVDSERIDLGAEVPDLALVLKRAARVGGGWMCAGADMPELLIPIPLHRARMRERGYNQALEITRAAARERA